MHIILHIILHILHFVGKSQCSISSDSLFLPLLFVPHPRAQLLTYHHLQPSLLSFVLSQTAPGKSLTLFAFRTVSSKIIVPAWRESSQYAGHWNDIQHLCSFFALVHDGGLTSIHPCHAEIPTQQK